MQYFNNKKYIKKIKQHHIRMYKSQQCITYSKLIHTQFEHVFMYTRQYTYTPKKQTIIVR
jgi:hypothetical protein